MRRAALILLYLTNALAFCPDYFKNQTACSCEDYFDGAVVKCSGKDGPGIVEMMKQTHHELRELALENAGIIQIGSRAFQNLRIKKLVLDNNRIEQLHKDAFKGLENVLVELSLAHNHFEKVPTSALSSLRSLNVLNMKCNRLQNITEPVFGNMSSLIDVDFSCNQICSISSEAFEGIKLTLQNLILDDNCMTTIPSALDNMSGLIALHMQYNELTNLGDSILNNLTSLNMLKLSGNNISEIDGGAVNNCPNIRYVYLTENNLSQLDGGSMGQFSHVQVLDLSYNFFEEITAEALAGMDSLQHLNLDSNHIRKIAPGAFEGKPLILLWLPNNCLNELNQQMFQGAPYLRQISLTNNNIRDIQPLTFAHLPNLHHLDLEQNKVSTLEKGAIPSIEHLTVRFQENPLVCLEGGFHVISGENAINITNQANNICKTKWQESEDICPKTSVRPTRTPCCTLKANNQRQTPKPTTTTEEPTTTTEEPTTTESVDNETEMEEEETDSEEDAEDSEETTTIITTTPKRKVNMDRFLRLQKGQIPNLRLPKSQRKPSKYMATTADPTEDEEDEDTEEDDEQEYEEEEEEEKEEVTTTTRVSRRMPPARVRDRQINKALPPWFGRSNSKSGKAAAPSEDFNRDDEAETVQVDRHT